jgi:hypothetical protein
MMEKIIDDLPNLFTVLSEHVENLPSLLLSFVKEKRKAVSPPRIEAWQWKTEDYKYHGRAVFHSMAHHQLL